MLKNYWKEIIGFNWIFGIGLILIFGIARFVIVLNGIISQSSNYVAVIFILMILTPFVLLNRKGRKHIGICKPSNFSWIIYSFLLGMIMATLVYLLGMALYQYSISNWFVYIGNTYPIELTTIATAEKKVYFIIFVIIGMTFSPFGEELLYRGIVHKSLATKFGEIKGAVMDSAAFGLTHLAHFGIIYIANEWHFLLVPALIWVTLIFLTGILFNICKFKSGSIWGAVVSHMGFNLSMTYFIFYHIF